MRAPLATVLLDKQERENKLHERCMLIAEHIMSLCIFVNKFPSIISHIPLLDPWKSSAYSSADFIEQSNYAILRADCVEE